MTDKNLPESKAWKIAATVCAVIFFAFLAVAILAPGSPGTPDASATPSLSGNPIIKGVGITALCIGLICAWIARSKKKPAGK